MSNSPQPINVFADTLDRVRTQALVVLPGTDVSRVQVEPPRDSSHGDIATNAAMVLAKPAGRSPLELANAIAQELRKDETITDVQVVPPGFINLRMKRGVWEQELRRAMAAGINYGRRDIGKGELVNVEYVSANPTGPMHVGHGRGAVFGDALANLLAFTGYKVYASITLMTLVRRLKCSHAQRICDTARHLARISEPFLKDSIPVNT
jgi:arginyl-tRNA synthetase